MKPKLDDDDIALFREAMRDVTPIGHTPPVAKPRRRAARARFARAGQLAGLDENLGSELSDPMVASDEDLSFRRPGVSEHVLRKLRRGEYGVQGEIDLHGRTVAEARHALRAFFGAALARHATCVRIIHGKGLRSGNRGPVLKSAVSALLRRTSAVVAYVSARPIDGGTGALYVLLSTFHS